MEETKLNYIINYLCFYINCVYIKGHRYKGQI
jgi:hypothetical protein